jgi:hypothetical protein
MNEQMKLADRATALRCWASRWDAMIGVFDDDTTIRHDGVTEQDAQDMLVAAAAAWAHPMLDRGTLRELMRDLRDVVGAYDRYLSGGWLPDTLEDHPSNLCGDGMSDEMACELMESDIDQALFPLLTALPMPCTECRRTRGDVTTWSGPKPGFGMRCEQHRLIIERAA